MNEVEQVAVIQAPQLAGDAHFGGRLPPHCRLERRIVANLIAHLAAAGFVPVEVDDGGDDNVACNDVKSAMEAIFSVDESVLFMAKPAGLEHGIVLIAGNGVDIVSDWNYSVGDPDGFNVAMDAFDAEAFA